MPDRSRHGRGSERVASGAAERMVDLQTGAAIPFNAWSKPPSLTPSQTTPAHTSTPRSTHPGIAVQSAKRNPPSKSQAATSSSQGKSGKRRPLPSQSIGLEGFIGNALAKKSGAPKAKKKSQSQLQQATAVSSRSQVTKPPNASTKSRGGGKKGLVPKKNVAQTANPNSLDAKVTRLVRYGKVKAPGTKKKHRISSLKKALYRDRALRWYLTSPDLKPFPLVIHPVFYEYIWKAREENDFINVQEPNGSQCSKPELGKSEAEESECVSTEPTHVVREDGLENEVDETGGEVLDVEQEQSGQDETLEDGDEFETEEVEPQENEDADLKEKNEVADAFIELHKHPSTWDACKISPIFFGSQAVPKHLVQSEEETPMNEESNPAEPKTGKKRREKAIIQRRIPNIRPVRAYVDQALSQELDNTVFTMLSRLMELQERLRVKDSVKSQMRRRLVFGFREVIRGIRSRRCKCIVVAPNIEQGSSITEGGIDDKIREMLDECLPTEDEKEQGLDGIPVVFALGKSKLGSALGKLVKVSAVGIYSADGAYDEYKKMLKQAEKLRNFWAAVVRREQVDNEYAICSDCFTPIDFVRYDCSKCRKVRCGRCASSAIAKKVQCSESIPSHMVVVSGTTELGDELLTCNIVRVARSVPPDALQRAADTAARMKKAADEEAKRKKKTGQEQKSKSNGRKIKKTSTLVPSEVKPTHKTLSPQAPEFVPRLYQ